MKFFGKLRNLPINICLPILKTICVHCLTISKTDSNADVGSLYIPSKRYIKKKSRGFGNSAINGNANVVSLHVKAQSGYLRYMIAPSAEFISDL